MAASDGESDLTEELNHRLYNAAEDGDVERARKCISDGANVNYQYRYGSTYRTPLYEASSHGHTDVVRLLLENKADPNISDEDGQTPLYRASFNGHTDVVKLLLENKADPNSDWNGYTPLHIASFIGHTAVVKLLLENKANPNISDRGGQTPLYEASSNGHTEVVRLLLENKVDPNISNEDGQTPLYTASSNGRTAVVKLLLENKADPNISDEDGYTPLYRASSHGHTAVVKLLLENKVDPNISDRNGDTPLGVADNSDICKLLIAHGATVEANYNNQWLYNAAKHGDVEWARKCISDGANVNYQYWFQRQTPLYTASDNGHIDVVKLLLENKADPNISDKDGKTPLYRASSSGHIDVVKLLLENKADPNISDNGGHTPLSVARNAAIRELLKAHGAVGNGNITDSSNAIPPSSSPPSSSKPVTDEIEYDAEYVKAMAEGSGELKHLNTVIHGPPGSGKSSLKRAILGEDPLPEEKQNSTDILENAVRAVSMDRLKSFAIITNEDLVELLAEAMLNEIKKVKESKSTADDSGAKPRGNKPLSNVPAIKSNEIKQRTVHDEESHRDIAVPKNTSASKDSPDSSSESVSPTLSKIRDMLKNGKFSSDLFNSEWHHLIDSGGQSQYQDIFPFLYKNRSFQIVLMRLIDGLDEKLPNCYTVKGENALKNQQRLQLTNHQYIEKICQIAASANPPSKVMIVGTHKDRLGDDAEAKIEELNQALEDIKKKYGEVLICKSDDEIIFDINTMAKGEERKEYTQELQQIMRDVFQELATSTPVPFRWLAFQLDISKDNGVVNMVDCHKSGEAVGMEVAAIKRALMYLNKAALLLYYPNDIPDVILTSVDPLVSKLSQLVKATFITPKSTLFEKCKRLRNTGIFNFEFLKHFSEDPPSALSNDLFLKLLLCLRIADYIGNDNYFLPSALSLDQPEKESPKQLSENKCTPVGFKFNNRILPHGFFFTVAIAFLGAASSDFVFELCPDERQFRQEIVFVEKRNCIPGVVTLTNRNTWIQVSTTSPAVKYCPNILKSVKIAIKKAIARFEGTTTLVPEFVSLCTIHPNSDHYCIPTRNNEDVSCSEDRRNVKAASDGMKCWLAENQPSTVSEESFITAVDDSELSDSSDALLKAISTVNDWHFLGLALDLEKYQLDVIYIDHRGNVSDCREAMISKWSDTGKASWRALVRAIASPLVEKTDLARKIAAEHATPTTCTNLPLLVTYDAGGIEPAPNVFKIQEGDVSNQPSSAASEESFITAVDDTKLSGSNLNDLLDAILSVTAWKQLGLNLGLEKYKLDNIEIDKHRIVQDCQMEMISLWLDTGNASWHALVRALASPLVGKGDLAEKIAAEHTESTPTTSTTSSQPVTTQPKPDVDESPPISPTNPSHHEAPPIPPLQQDVNGISESTVKEFSARIHDCVKHYNDKKPQGIMFIVGMYGAPGTDVDVKTVQSTFEHTNINFAILPIQSPTSAQISALIAAASNYGYPFWYKFVAFYFCGHGGIDNNRNPFVQTLSEGRVLIEPSIIEPLKSIEKIRLFFFDCCLSQPSPTAGTRSVDTARSDDTSSAPPIIKRNCTQGEVVAYAVSKGQKAYGDQKEGGYWTQRLCVNIKVPDPIVTVLAKTNREVQKAGGQTPLTVFNVDDTVIICTPPIPPLLQDVNGISEREFSVRINDDVKDLSAPQIPLTVSNVDNTVIISNTVPQTDHGQEATDATGNNPVTEQPMPSSGKTRPPITNSEPPVCCSCPPNCCIFTTR